MKFISKLLKIKNSIFKATFMLISANRKVFLKNQDFSTLSSIKKDTIIISKILSLKLLIFWVPTLVFQMLKPSF